MTLPDPGKQPPTPGGVASDSAPVCAYNTPLCGPTRCVRVAALRVVMMPKDTNPDGSVFGGVILSQLDIAGVIEARRHGLHRYVTAAMDKVVFIAPVYVGDIVSFFAQTTRVGNTSLTVQIDVCAERRDGRSCVNVTSATVTYVAVDGHGHPVPVASTHTLPYSDDGK